MITFAAITPHSPLLLPTIGKEHEKKFKDTLKSFLELKKRLKAAAPDVIVIFSPHGTVLADAVVLNLHDDYEGDLREFGDLATKPYFKSDPELIHRLQKSLRESDQPITLLSSHTIDYGITVPLALLAAKSNCRLLPITPALFDAKKTYTVGEAIKDELMKTNKKIAVIASADLSHRLTSDTPLGFSPKGREFDENIREALETGNISRLLRLDPEIVSEAGPCGFQSIIMLLGILSGISYQAKVMSYEAPFGVGHLTVNFELN